MDLRIGNLSTHLRRMVTLAWPMMLAQGLSLMAFVVDTAMVGQAGGAELAYLSSGRTLTMVVTMVGVGLLNGIVVFTARADGARDHTACGPIWQAGMLFAAMLGLMAVVVVSVLGPLTLMWFGLSDDLVAGGSRYLAVIGLSVPGSFLFMAGSYFLQGVSRPKPAMMVMLVLTPMNVLLNWLFIYGHLGVPAMGAAGAALATVLSQWAGAVAIFAYVLRSPYTQDYGVRHFIRGTFHVLWRQIKKLWRFGLPLGIAAGLEFFGITILVMFAGRLGEDVISAFEVAFNLQIVAFIAAFGCASATAVRVGNAVGGRRYKDIGVVGAVGIGLGLALVAMFALLYLATPMTFVRLFTENAAVQVLAGQFVIFIVVAIFFDCVQFICLQSLRAAGDQVMGSVLQVTAFLVIMVPVAWALAFPLGLGGAGLMMGFVAGTLSAAVMLGGRFIHISRRYAATAD